MSQTKQGKEFTGFILLRCPCKNIIRIEVGIHALKGFAADGVTPQNYHLMKVQCQCGRELCVGWGKPIYGSLSLVTRCSPRCANSVNPICHCSCKGANHSKNWSIK